MTYYSLAELEAIADVGERFDLGGRAARAFLEEVGYLGDDRTAS